MSNKRPEQSARRTSPRAENLCALASVITIPLSLWCFDLANHAIFPSRLLRELWGPQMHTGHTSFPDYGEWDIATMMLMVAASGISAIYLVVWVIRGPLRVSRRH